MALVTWMVAVSGCSLCSELGLAIINTFFQLRHMHKTSWIHPRSKQWHLIDYVIVRRHDMNEVHITGKWCAIHSLFLPGVVMSQTKSSGSLILGSCIWHILHKCAHSNTYSWWPCSRRDCYVARPSIRRYNWVGSLGSIALVGNQTKGRKTLISNPGRRSSLALQGSSSRRRKTLISNPGRRSSLALQGSSSRRRKTLISNP